MLADIMVVSPEGTITLSQRAMRSLGVCPGSRLVGHIHGNTLVIQSESDSEDNLTAVLDRMADWAESVGLTEEDIRDAIREERAASRRES